MRYTVLSNEIWQDEAFQELDRENKLMYFYLLSSPYGNAAGIYRLLERSVDRDMWDGASKMLYTDTKLWKYDKASSTVIIPNYLKYNQAKNDKQIKGLNNVLKGLPETKLLVDFFFAFYKYCGDEKIDLFDGWIRRIAKAEAMRILDQTPTDRVALVVTNIFRDT